MRGSVPPAAAAGEVTAMTAITNIATNPSCVTTRKTGANDALPSIAERRKSHASSYARLPTTRPVAGHGEGHGLSHKLLGGDLPGPYGNITLSFPQFQSSSGKSWVSASSRSSDVNYGESFGSDRGGV